jgi:hypothetical protein
LTRVFRLINVVSKRKIGVFFGIAVGLAACLVTPLTFSFFYAKAMHWVTATLDGRLEFPLTLLALTLLMIIAAALLFALRIFVARTFRGRRYGPRRIVLQ